MSLFGCALTLNRDIRARYRTNPSEGKTVPAECRAPTLEIGSIFASEAFIPVRERAKQNPSEASSSSRRRAATLGQRRRRYSLPPVRRPAGGDLLLPPFLPAAAFSPSLTSLSSAGWDRSGETGASPAASSRHPSSVLTVAAFSPSLGRRRAGGAGTPASCPLRRAVSSAPLSPSSPGWCET